MTDQNSTFDSSKYTILIVDDNPNNLRVMSDYLADYGFQTTIARTGESALKRAEYGQPNIILLDVMMPGIDGFETCRCLKLNPATNQIPVIFMTALVDTADKVRGFSVGAVDYVTKPFHQEEVLARISTHLQLRSLTQDLQDSNQRLKSMTTLLSRRALYLEASSELTQELTSLLDVEMLLEKAVQLIQAKFGYYFVGMWLPEEADKFVSLQLVVGQARQSKEAIPKVKVVAGQDKTLPLWVYGAGHAYVANDVTLDEHHKPLDFLPATAAELALPLKIDPHTIGVLDIHSDRLGAFTHEERDVLQTLANQVAVAIQNARLFATEKMLRQEAAERANELDALNQGKDKLFSILAHDLRGPFIPLLGWLEVLADMVDNAEPEKLKSSINTTYQAAKNLHSLLENLLTWSKIQLDRVEYNPSPVRLRPLVELDTMVIQQAAIDKHIDVKNNIPDQLAVFADVDMVHTICRNLFSNAVKFTPNGGSITVSAEEQSEMVALKIVDTGVGIPSEILQNLFNMETLYSTIGTDGETGSGFGLMLCKEMVAKNKGQISISSEVRVGTAVIVSLPKVTF